MINLIGWAVGNAIARDAKASNDEVARLSLLGAASPSPLLGAVLVRSALDQETRDRSAIGAPGDGAGSVSDGGARGGEAGSGNGGSTYGSERPGERFPSGPIGEKEKELLAALARYNAARAERGSDPQSLGDAVHDVREHLDALIDAMTADLLKGSESGY